MQILILFILLLLNSCSSSHLNLDKNLNDDYTISRLPATDNDCSKIATELILRPEKNNYQEAILAKEAVQGLGDSFYLRGSKNPSSDEWKSQNFTNPEAYDATKPFRFIVHKLTALDGNWTKKMLGTSAPIDLISNPQDISNARILSASIISENKRTTYGGVVGLILKIPETNIVATRPADMQSMIPLGKALADSEDSFERTLSKFHKFYGIENPNTLLKHTSTGLYNEMIAVGTGTVGEKVEVIGIALFETNGYLPLFPGVETKLLESASNNHLPVIRIPVINDINLSEYAIFEEENQNFQKLLKAP
ncbi:MAG: hypothetical protein PHY93_13905 [Bacteriovorax sp.]|nr:hypothetical protein [Bacteriovorax sp.]